MITIQVYPVMDGLEVWVSGVCTRGEHSDLEHVHGHVHLWLDSEVIDKLGVEWAVGNEVSRALSEYPGLARITRC